MDRWNTAEADKATVYDAFANVVKAIANGRRLELIEFLAQGEHSVEALARMSGMSVTSTSAHLQTLKQAGLVRTRREGTTIHHRLAGDDVAELYLAAKRVGLQRSPDLREAVGAYIGHNDDDDGSGLSVDPSTVTSAMAVIDVRPRGEFEAGHFPGAISLPLAELEDRFDEVPREREIVVYCRGEFCRMARDAARWLRDRGVDARAMDEGVIEWRVSKEVDLDIA